MTKVPVQPEHVQLRVIPTIVQRHAEDASSYWRAIANNLEGLRVAQLESAQARAHRRFGLVGHQEPAEPLGHQR